ncbi:hypothetical protein Zmor_011212 [Zophobas morio]|uniref:Tyr recombinase domain-containing protein n=1 Tax=Zophobas morio TaxID=2755281 RepID=A0AA38MKQ7_9CUCU|nr:hypothetical protein Zmor_011212 [Zophobas morio]
MIRSHIKYQDLYARNNGYANFIKSALYSSLWSYYSQLKKMLSVKENIDISRFHQVSAFLKQHSVGHRPKKSKVFTLEEMERFLDNASDDVYLLQKVIFVVGVFGGCRMGELVAMSVDDVEDRGSVLVVQIPDTKTLFYPFIGNLI